MEPRDARILRRITAEIRIMFEMTGGLDFEAFSTDEKIKRAVCMTLINIGEWVKGLSDALKERHPSIPWRAIAGLRDIVVHKYQTLKMEDVWATVKNDIAPLYREIMGMIDSCTIDE